MYTHLIRPLLFRLDPERAHDFSIASLSRIARIPGALALLRQAYGHRVPDLPVEVMGLRFPNPLGLAAGLDKDARCIEALSALGFGYLELGTVTPRPQPGNPPPRMFRLPEREAIINRMGFNSRGIGNFLDNIARAEHQVPLGINLGKNATTALEDAAADYVSGLKQLYLYADYFTINISSPNTRNLRDLQSSDALGGLLAAIAAARRELIDTFGRRVPIAVKIAPDIDDMQVPGIIALLLEHGIDAVIATNTTISRSGVEDLPHAEENGGLSGQPLTVRADEVVRRLYTESRGRIPIIGVGGIGSAEQAWQRLVAGADLLQLYSALIYRGPGLIGEIVRGLKARVVDSGQPDLRRAVAAARGTLTP